MSPFDSIAASKKSIVVAIGVFDGVHVGHEAVVTEAIRAARKAKGEAWALTFEPHPMSVVRPANAPKLLTSPKHKEELLQKLGLAGCIAIPFTQALASQSPSEFIETLKKHVPRLLGVVVGENFRFGHQAKGDIELLAELGAKHGFTTTAMPPVLYLGEPVSSTRIRSAIQEGDLSTAACMLGRPFSLRGKVSPGKQIGRTLGFPTANLDIAGLIRPCPGVYAVTAEIDGHVHGGAAYVGNRPSYQDDGGTAIAEVHLLGINRELYGNTLELYLIEKVRDDMRFSSDNALKEQIRLDVEQARYILSRHKGAIVASAAGPQRKI